MPLPPSHSNFYDNEDDEGDYNQAESDVSHWGKRKRKMMYHGGKPSDHMKDKVWAKSQEEPSTARHTDVGNPVVYPNTATGREMRDRLNKGYHPDNPKYFVEGDTPAEKEKERSRRLNYMDDV